MQKSQIDKIYLIEIAIFPHSTGSGFFSGKFGQKFSVISDHIYIKEQKYINQSLAQIFPSNIIKIIKNLKTTNWKNRIF